MAANKQDDLVDGKTLMKVFDYDSIRSIQRLTQDGVIDSIEVIENGRKVHRYDLMQSNLKFIRFLKNKAYGREQKSSVTDKEEEKLQAEVDLKKTKAKIAQLELDELEGRMHSAEDVESMTTDLCLAVRSALLSMPGQLSIDVTEAENAAEASEIIKKAVNDILDELSRYEYDPNEYRRRVRERRGWLERMEKEEDDSE